MTVQTDRSDFLERSAAIPSVLLREVKRLGLEGVIGKQRGSVYEPDRRSGAWIKLKCVNEQEFVIGGFTPPQGARKHFGALLVGYYEKKRLLFAGKVGTGFTPNCWRSCTNVSRARSAMIVRLPICHRRQGGQWVSGHHARDDASMRMDRSGFCLPGEVRRMDTRREVAPAGFPGIA